MLSKLKINDSTEYSPVYFNSTTKTVINRELINLFKFISLDKSFQEILYRVDNWVNQGSGWIVESIDGQYLNVSFYNSLIGSTYVDLPSELKNSRKGLFNIQNDDNKCFL